MAIHSHTFGVFHFPFSFNLFSPFCFQLFTNTKQNNMTLKKKTNSYLTPSHPITFFPLLFLSLPPSLSVPPPPSLSACPLQLLWSILAVYLCNHVVPTIGLTPDQDQTRLDLVPMPRAAICMPFSPFILFA